jgi:hypothetical protein
MKVRIENMPMAARSIRQRSSTDKMLCFFFLLISVNSIPKNDPPRQIIINKSTQQFENRLSF